MVAIYALSSFRRLAKSPIAFPKPGIPQGLGKAIGGLLVVKFWQGESRPTLL